MNGNNNSFNTYLENTDDLGLFTEVETLKHAETETTIKLGEKYFTTIWPVNYADTGNRVPVYSRCVSYALSAEIDSVARAHYIISKRTERPNIFK